MKVLRNTTKFGRFFCVTERRAEVREKRSYNNYGLPTLLLYVTRNIFSRHYSPPAGSLKTHELAPRSLSPMPHFHRIPLDSINLAYTIYNKHSKWDPQDILSTHHRNRYIHNVPNVPTPTKSRG